MKVAAREEEARARPGRLLEARRSAARRRAGSSLGFGVLMLVVGVALSAATFQSESGGSRVFAGLIVGGVLACVWGIVGLAIPSDGAPDR